MRPKIPVSTFSRNIDELKKTWSIMPYKLTQCFGNSKVLSGERVSRGRCPYPSHQEREVAPEGCSGCQFPVYLAGLLLSLLTPSCCLLLFCSLGREKRDATRDIVPDIVTTVLPWSDIFIMVLSRKPQGN